MEVSPEVSQQLLEECAVLVVLGAPRGSYFGLDLKAWNTEAEFRGLKMIPPGLHYVHYSVSDIDTGDTAPRIGFLHNFKSNEMVVRMWDKENEELSNEPVSDETVARLRTNLYNLDKFLAPYPYEIYKTWKSLSSQITDELVRKLMPESGNIRSALELVSCNDTNRPRGKNKTEFNDKENNLVNESFSQDEISILKPQIDSSTKNIDCELPSTSGSFDSSLEFVDKPKRRSRTLTLEEKEQELLPNLKPLPGSEIRFSIFPEYKYPTDATPAEITKHCLDQTYLFELLIKNHTKPMDILGELQFAYICFLIGHSLDAFEFWKKLVHVFCSCEEALKKYCDVFMHFVWTLKVQLEEIPEEFLADIVQNENFVYVALRKFFRTVYETDVHPKLKTVVDCFQRFLTDKFLWNFHNLDAEEEDELPVIVHL